MWFKVLAVLCTVSRMFKKVFIVVLDIIVYNKEDKVERQVEGSSG